MTGGWGDGTVVVTCTLCREGQAAVSQTGLWDAVCPKCGATIISEDGRVQFCFPQKKQPTDPYDTDDSWL